jgi:hypothetical protein
VIYSFPVKDSTGITLEYILEKRDSVMKAHLPGEVEGYIWEPNTVIYRQFSKNFA